VDLSLPWVVGAGLAVGVSVFARVVGLDRDRAFYPTVLIVIAVLYDLFAVLGGSTQALLVELGFPACSSRSPHWASGATSGSWPSASSATA